MHNRFSRFFVALLGSVCLCSNAWAAFPDRPMTLYVGLGAGNPADVEARLLASEMREQLGQPVVVQNLPGSSGAKAYTACYKAKGDGYTMSVVTFTFPVHSARKTLPFTHNDFKYINGISGDPAIVIVANDSPYKTIEDFVAAGRNAERPLTVGISTPGSGLDIAARTLMKATGMNLRIVAHKEGPAQMSAAVAGKHLDCGVSNASASYSLIKAGKVRILGVMGDNRLASFPDVPTFKEVGIPEASLLISRFIVVPKGTSDDIVNLLHDAVSKAKKSDRFEQYLFSHSSDPMEMTPEECKKFMDNQVDTLKPIMKELGMIKK